MSITVVIALNVVTLHFVYASPRGSLDRDGIQTYQWEHKKCPIITSGTSHAVCSTKDKQMGPCNVTRCGLLVVETETETEDDTTGGK